LGVTSTVRREHLTYQVTIPATASLVPVADLKTHLLLFGDTSYDTELQDILLTAEGFVSDFLGDFLATTTVRKNIVAFGDIELPHKSPTNIVVSYWDTSNTAQVWPSSNYVVDTSDVYPVIIFNTNPSGFSTKFANKGFVTYDTVLDPVTAKIKHAVLLIAAELFENRNNSSEKKMEKVQLTAMRLMQSLRGW
jgi:hypothetical protein